MEYSAIYIDGTRGDVIRKRWSILFFFAAAVQVWELFAIANLLTMVMSFSEALPRMAIGWCGSIAFFGALYFFAFRRGGVWVLIGCQVLILARLFYAVSPSATILALLGWEALQHLLAAASALPLFVYSWKLFRLNQAQRKGVTCSPLGPAPGSHGVQRRWRLLFWVTLTGWTAMVWHYFWNTIVHKAAYGNFELLALLLLPTFIGLTWSACLYLCGYRGQLTVILWLGQIWTFLGAVFLLALARLFWGWLPGVSNCGGLAALKIWFIVETAILIRFYRRGRTDGLEHLDGKTA